MEQDCLMKVFIILEIGPSFMELQTAM